MADEAPKVTITEPSNNYDAPSIKIADIKEITKRSDTLLFLVIGAMLVGFASLLIMTAGIVIDTWRFNSSVYKESKSLQIQQEVIQQNLETQKSLTEKIEQLDQTIQNLKKQ